MIEEIRKGLFKLEIPLPGSPLKSLNSYLIKDRDRNLIIDTGMNREECFNAMQFCLNELRVDLKKTDFYITHFHIDHVGLISSLSTEKSTIYFNQPDADRVKSGLFLENLIAFALVNGFPEDELEIIRHTHPSGGFRLKENPKFHILKEDDVISIYKYTFRCIETPGHTRGHMCLYEPRQKIFVAGDHILNDITPNIQLMSDEWDSLKAYFRSLDKVYDLDINLVLPGHRSTFTQCGERILELKHHHQERLDEIISILGEEKKNAFQIASEMSWEIVHHSWDSFPVIQKWFAMGEAIAHLKYLEGKRIVQKERLENQNLYFLHTLKDYKFQKPPPVVF